jgi:serine/threonine-protein kinase
MDMYAAPQPPRLPPGTRLNGMFEIDQRIASGGMGEIYRGHVVETGDPVAIKMMRLDLADNAMALALFRKEASALHNIHHEAIIRYYVFSHDPGIGRHYLAMEFVDGLPLSDLLRQGPLGLSSVRTLQERLAAGLSAAHQLGIIHRDLSPDNVLIPGRDLARAKIIDFGIARSTRSGEGTIIGSAFAGKYNYVSPEQLGLFGGDVTPRSDIYSLGLVLAACVLGRPLDMGGTQFEVLEKRRTVPDLTAVDSRFRPLLASMLQPDPADRPESMAAVAAWRPGQGATAAPRRGATGGRARPAAAAARPDAPRSRRLAATAAVLVLLPGIGAAGWYFAKDLWDLVSPAVTALPTLPDLKAPDLDSADLKPSDLKSSDLKPSDPRLPDLDPKAPKLAGFGPMKPERPSSDPRQRIIDFVNAYDGGDCFFITPEAVDDGKANIDGLGNSVAPFEVLDYEFRRHNGFEASIGVHQVMPEQCPAISFLYQTRQQRGAAPRLDLFSTGLKDGAVKGSVSDSGERTVELLLVGDDGYVRNLTNLLKSDGTVKTFGMTLTRTNPGPPRPQLLMAVGLSKPLAALKLPPDGALAEQVFTQVLAEAAQAGQLVSVSARYFMLEK